MSSELPSSVASSPDEAPIRSQSVDIPAARDLVRIFAKTAKATRLYARNNEVYQRFWNELVARMDAYLDLHATLSLQISTHDVRVGAEVVFQPKEQDDNFAFRLYKDGLRQIDFLKGLPHAELQHFLEIITADFDRGDFQDKDVVSLIWECEFRHIFTLSVDSFVQETQAENQEEDEEPAEQEPQAFSDAEADQLFEILQQSTEVNLLKLDVEEKREYRVVSAGTASFSERNAVHGGQIFQIDPNLELRLKAEVEVLGLEETPTEVIAEIIFELFRQETPEEYPQLISIMLGVIDSLIAEADLETLNQLLFPLRLLSIPDYARAFLNHGLVQELFSHLGVASRVEPLLLPIQEGRLRGGIPALFGFLSLQLPEHIPGLLKWLDRITDDGARRAGVDALITVAGEDLEPFYSAVRTGNPKLVADLIFAMGKLGSLQSLEVILGAFSHSEARVREETLVALRNFESPRARETIFLALSDPAESVRLAALRYMTVHRDRQTARFLMEQMQGRGFKARSFVEMRAMCMALAHIQGMESLGTLSGLLKQKRMGELQRAAAHGLALLGGQDVRRLFEQAIRESTGPVADECRMLLLELK